jgi:hypothetical protein
MTLPVSRSSRIPVATMLASFEVRRLNSWATVYCTSGGGGGTIVATGIVGGGAVMIIYATVTLRVSTSAIKVARASDVISRPYVSSRDISRHVFVLSWS